MLEALSAGVNVIAVAATTTAQQISGYSPGRMSLMLPKCSGSDWYEISFQKGMASTYCWRMDANSNSTVLTRAKLLSVITNTIFLKASGSITVEITEICLDPGWFDSNGIPLIGAR